MLACDIQHVSAGVLLHHLEVHIGIVVLITNKPDAIDTAFQRRIRFSLTFPMPDAALRYDFILHNSFFHQSHVNTHLLAELSCTFQHLAVSTWFDCMVKWWSTACVYSLASDKFMWCSFKIMQKTVSAGKTSC